MKIKDDHIKLLSVISGTILEGVILQFEKIKSKLNKENADELLTELVLGLEIVNEHYFPTVKALDKIIQSVAFPCIPSELETTLLTLYLKVLGFSY